MRASGARVRCRTFHRLALLVAAVALTSCANWRGIANLPMPGGPGTGPGSYTVYVQIPDALAMNNNSRVQVADVFVGTVRAIELKNWVATLTLRMDKNIKLPRNATAKIGQTTLLGSQHLELAAPPNPSPELLKDGDTIPLKNSSDYPTIEQTLASLALVVRGGGIPNLEVLANEVYNVVNGRAEQIRAFLGKLDTFTARLNEQRDDITRAIDSTNRLLAYVGPRSDVLDRALTEFPPVIKYFADKQNLLINSVEATGALSQVSDQYLSASVSNLHQDLLSLQCPLRELGRASPYLIRAIKLLVARPFDLDAVQKAIRGDYYNLSVTLDLTMSAVDNAVLTGTGFSGALRALEQSWGRDPETMIPDVRYTSNPNDAPGGPLVERADRQC
ncbi:virulence factor Mce family protein [Mycobacterium sp. 852014-50255_SCH5639931]|uniref:virulence factor Mce family protein n=1 Tax=Mycobacterium sp. 852014-50255_SCH5639931 TaxID=1834112 RepID=UPI0008016C5B|nr:virulence factor Mce family protein [Mycobacterium sp. 852014-50255_SCH5639931]OBB70268.1 mammalian cell entry protein [Mycobacterium sp. 852014-50255_SCH5639931]